MRRLEKALVSAVSSALALVVALVICGVILAVTGRNPFTVYWAMLQSVASRDAFFDAVQRSIPLMISGVAVAIGFRANLFNIGVEGQYLLATLVAAVAGAAVHLPPILHVTFILLVAMATGAAWAGVAGVLRVYRGVNEVISTIMLNAIALSLAAWLFDSFWRVDTMSGGENLDVKTKPIPPSGWMPDMVKDKLSWFIVIALAVAIIYGVVVNSTPIGFRLRATGINPGAARIAGIAPEPMVMGTLLLSGAVAGLVGMPALLGRLHAYGQGLDKGLGFTGIAVALLGRNRPIGIVLSAVFFGYLGTASAPLQLEGVPKELTAIIQGVAVLAVVIINEVLARAYDRWTKSRLSGDTGLGPTVDGAAPALEPA